MRSAFINIRFYVHRQHAPFLREEWDLPASEYGFSRQLLFLLSLLPRRSVLLQLITNNGKKFKVIHIKHKVCHSIPPLIVVVSVFSICIIFLLNFWLRWGIFPSRVFVAFVRKKEFSVVWRMSVIIISFIWVFWNVGNLLTLWVLLFSYANIKRAKNPFSALLVANLCNS